MARPRAADAILHEHLTRAKERGKAEIEQIIEHYARPRGWPAELARQYLTRNLQFDIGPRQIEAMQRFHDLAAAEGIIARPRPLEIFTP
jgi:predicted solute-binding protein